MADKKFKFKQGADLDALLEEKVEQRLAELLAGKKEKPEEKDEDFELLELEKEETPAKPKKAKKPAAPKISKSKKKLKIEEKKHVIEGQEDREDFEEHLLTFKDARTKFNALKKEIDEGRDLILEEMAGDLLFEGESAVLKIAETPQSTVNAETVIEALVDMETDDIDELKAGLQEIIDMARMGLLSIGKTKFDGWIKGKGQEAGPYLVAGSPKKVIRITSK